MITVGIVIGAGISETPALVAGMAGSPLAMLALWLLGALTYAELASTWAGGGAVSRCSCCGGGSHPGIARSRCSGIRCYRWCS